MRVIRKIFALLGALALSACVSPPPVQTGSKGTPPLPRPQTSPTAPITIPPSTPSPPPVAGFRMPDILEGPGLGGIIEEEADALIRQFGRPRLDVREGDMRKLQFAAAPCVMDIYLYPLSPDSEPVSTWIETRRASDGQEVDRLACIQALRILGR